jgi:hypothetical protein
MMRKKSRLLNFGLITFVCLGTLAFRKAFPSEDEAARILDRNCTSAGCHTGPYPAMGLDLRPESFKAALIEIPSQERSELKLVDIRAPEKSYLLMKIRGEVGIAGNRMPLNAPALSEEETQIIARWVMDLKDTEPGLETVGIKRPQQKTGTKSGAGPAFWGTRLMNLPTPRSIGAKQVLFRISHRFYPSVSAGYDVFYGFNGPASILLSLGYGLSDNLSITMGHSNRAHEWMLASKWEFLREGKLDIPLTASLSLGAGLVTEQREGISTFSSDNMKFSAQLSLAYRIDDIFSILLTPGYASNVNHWEEDSQGTLALGTGARLMLGRDFSVLVEIIPVLTGYNARVTGWGVGLEKKLGGHMFQVFALNSVGLTEPQYLPGGDLCINDGDFRFGFTIFRWF